MRLSFSNFVAVRATVMKQYTKPMSEANFFSGGLGTISDSGICRGRYLVWIIMLLLASPLVGYAQEGQDVLGEWYTEERKAKVEIYACGDAYCGKIVWLKEPNNPDGTPKVDDENPNEALRSRKIIGSNILTGLIYEGEGEWDDGEIYDPESGKTYSCLMELEDGILEVRGFIGLSLIGRSQTWTRVE